MSKKTTLTPIDQQQRRLARRYLETRAEAIELLNKADAILDVLISRCLPGQEITVRGVRYILRDNFADKNVGYRAARFIRFELVEAPKGKREKKG